MSRGHGQDEGGHHGLAFVALAIGIAIGYTAHAVGGKVMVRYMADCCDRCCEVGCCDDGCRDGCCCCGDRCADDPLA